MASARGGLRTEDNGGGSAVGPCGHHFRVLGGEVLWVKN